MNKIEQKQIQFTQAQEQEQLIGYWIKKYDINKQVLDTHPCIDDIIALLEVRAFLKQYKGFTTLSHDAKIGVMWQSVYNRKRKLYPKHYKTLEAIVLEITQKAQQQQEKKQAMKALIQQARVKANG
jgi:hypothetical protein